MNASSPGVCVENADESAFPVACHGVEPPEGATQDAGAQMIVCDLDELVRWGGDRGGAGQL